MANSDILFPIFSETIHTILKIFSQHDLRKVKGQVKVTVKKQGVRILDQNVWLGCLSAFTFSILFLTVKLKLGHNSEFIYRFKIRTFESWSQAVLSDFFPINKEIEN